MLSAYVPEPQGLQRRVSTADEPLPQDAVWLDLYVPTVEEERKVESFLGVDVPTREEMREIESSARLYEEKGALYLTATVATKLDTDLPENTQITFILAGNRIVTNRYVDPLSFRRFASYAERHLAQCSSGPGVLAGLLEAIVDRSADVLERVGANLDDVSANVFARPKGRRPQSRDFRTVLEQVGRNGDLISRTRESLVSLGRLLVFVQQATTESLTAEIRGRFRTLSRDVTQMSDHASFLGNKVAFILDATLGMVNIDQNNILKIFSVVTVFLLPPSVIGAIYGMNFEHIPWLHEAWGFWYALATMIVSAILPWAIFKWRGWL